MLFWSAPSEPTNLLLSPLPYTVSDLLRGDGARSGGDGRPARDDHERGSSQGGRPRLSRHAPPVELVQVANR